MKTITPNDFPALLDRINKLERKVSLLVRTSTSIQLQTENNIAKINKALTGLRNALPHVNWGDI